MLPARRRTKPTGFDGLWNHNVAYYQEVLDAMPSPCDAALDIGCGGGLLARTLAQHAAHVTAIDLDQACIDEARRLSASHANIAYIDGDFIAEPFGDETFDFIAAVSSLHHMSFADALAKAARLLRPGGTLIVVGPARSNTFIDLSYDAVGVIANRVARACRGWWHHDAPVLEPDMTYTDVRRTAANQLPGCAVRRRLYFRYTLTWARPCASDSST